MELKTWLAVALLAVLLGMVRPLLLVTSSATTAGTLGLTITNPALAAVSGAALLLAVAGVAAAAATTFRGRGRRAAGVAAADGSISANTADILFAAAGSLDRQTNCGLRLVCELAATPEDQLADDEALVMSLFGRRSILTHDDHVNSPIRPYQLAVSLGRQTGSGATCAKTYSRCPYTSRQVMDILRHNSVAEEDPRLRTR